MDLHAVRQALAAFLGPEKFQRLISSPLSTNGRLRFWQQSLWDEFTIANPSYADATDLLPAIFRYCILHDLDLLPDKISGTYGEIVHAPEYERDALRDFPYAAIGPWKTEGKLKVELTIDVWYCPKCREAYAQSPWADLDRSSQTAK